LEGLALEDVGIFFGLLAYFAAILCIVRPFGIYFMLIWYIFPVFSMLYEDKSGNPDSVPRSFLPQTAGRKIRLLGITIIIPPACH
jgi:hypothetical protein